MKHLFILGMMLIPSLAHGQAMNHIAPDLMVNYPELYKRPIDTVNPYKYERPANRLDLVAYWKARRQVAETCQNISLALENNRIKGSKKDLAELSSLMGTCTPDELEWDATVKCRETGIPMESCPVTELLILDVTFLKQALP